MQKEVDEMKAIAHEARKKTKMAKKGSGGRAQTMAMLAESKIPMGLSPRNYLIQKLKQPPKKIELRKLENARTSLTNLCCMCHKKRNKMDYGSPCLTCEMQM
ncbi:hypothetical protein LIER_08211 [Lithospermum erythrorhizon]|uniref:Uncharacterized protein n=1 Tax=Lithospermum erythrorhizon TaxID=34254 RepID=A0AAV3PDW9_LITER